MKDDEREAREEMLEEYDFGGAVRGKYARRYAEGSNVVVLSPDVAEAFPDSRTVNDALRALLAVAQRSVRRPG
jgi:alpha/beta superfamily hydrolase